MQQQLGWRARKRVVARVASAMAMAMKRAMVTNDDTTDNGHSKEDGRRLTVATMGMAHRTQPLALRLERGG